MSLLLTGVAQAAIPNAILHSIHSLPKLSVPECYRTSLNGTALPPITTVYHFGQLIDHNDTGLRAFQQRYCMSWEFYEPCVPIISVTPGEGNTDGNDEAHTTDETINGLIAQQQNGAAILIEHHFFGYSNPNDNLTSQSLALLTIQQAIDDLVYFATTADLPMPGGDAVKPEKQD
ncbi:uncharacterized protein BJ212DRAFT_1289897 [Suillus subaureus]|uniref:Uncharacterized protein n=1 Tax=Suillus subaureus TaxID=48587 RepID=A0A9P7DKQ3_9AGAM|nr:uncharacterized protein BJ212DRAFT_1289897 [Suillus subaureus]KAG1797193.1 hypothetical protein BJ212DRAFT_1289897 [Suillus subaureus]